ncbi:MAG: cytochrome c oxidase subunit 3 [Deltaproteobacteria bacterium]
MTEAPAAAPSSSRGLFQSKGRLGVALLILSEGTFFLVLLLAFALFHGAGEAAARRALDPVKSFVFSLFLFSSSLTIWRASKAAAAARLRATTAWLAATVGLGAVFLVGQTLEYRHLFAIDVTAGSGPFGQTFFALTGFHALHVLAGLVAIGSLGALSFREGFDEARREGLEAVAMYWHFVDLVWVFIFSIVYLWGRA